MSIRPFREQFLCKLNNNNTTPDDELIEGLEQEFCAGALLNTFCTLKEKELEIMFPHDKNDDETKNKISTWMTGFLESGNVSDLFDFKITPHHNGIGVNVCLFLRCQIAGSATKGLRPLEP